MEETSDSATFGQSILVTKGERLSALVIPAGSLPPSSLLSSPFIVFVFVFLISHLSFLILSSFSFYRLSHFIVFLILLLKSLQM